MARFIIADLTDPMPRVNITRAVEIGLAIHLDKAESRSPENQRSEGGCPYQGQA